MKDLNSVQMEFDFLTPETVEFKKQENKLTKSEQALYKIIPTGKCNAIKTADLAKILGIKPRQVTYLIQKLRMKHFSICSSLSAPESGIYKPANFIEYNEFHKRYELDAFNRLKLLNAMNYSKFGLMRLTGENKPKIPPNKSA